MCLARSKIFACMAVYREHGLTLGLMFLSAPALPCLCKLFLNCSRHLAYIGPSLGYFYWGKKHSRQIFIHILKIFSEFGGRNIGRDHRHTAHLTILLCDSPLFLFFLFPPSLSFWHNHAFPWVHFHILWGSLQSQHLPQAGLLRSDFQTKVVLSRKKNPGEHNFLHFITMGE